MTKIALDKTDRKILSILQSDGRLSNQDVAEQVNLSPSPCLRRIKRLEEEGVIRQYVALLDPDKIGLGLLAFSTASSEAAYPKLLVALDKFGVQRRISSFVLPMGYSFNLDGSMMYCTFAVLFIAQAYGIDLSLGTQITMLLLLMLTSKGMAGVPRASLVVIAATLTQFHIPEAGLLLLMGVDQFLDMGRSATNAVGNAIATAVVAKWEGALGEEEQADEHSYIRAA